MQIKRADGDLQQQIAPGGTDLLLTGESWLRVRSPAPPAKPWPGCPASLGSMMLVVHQRFSLAPSGGMCARTS